jgi:hypothetical protein
MIKARGIPDGVYDSLGHFLFKPLSRFVQTSIPVFCTIMSCTSVQLHAATRHSFPGTCTDSMRSSHIMTIVINAATARPVLHFGRPLS